MTTPTTAPNEHWLIPDPQGAGVAHHTHTLTGETPTHRHNLDLRTWHSTCGEVTRILMHHSRPATSTTAHCTTCTTALTTQATPAAAA